MPSEDFGSVFYLASKATELAFVLVALCGLPESKSSSAALLQSASKVNIISSFFLSFEFLLSYKCSFAMAVYLESLPSPRCHQSQFQLRNVHPACSN